MIVRMVRMTFKPESTGTFVALYRSVSSRIKATPGCYEVGLYHDVNVPNTYATISQWESVAHLDAYRESEFFKTTWSTVRPLLAEKAQAYSYEILPVGQKGGEEE